MVMKARGMLDFLWLFVVMMGPVLLGGAIAYAAIRQRRLSGEQRDNRDATTRQLYRKNEAADTRPFGVRR